MSAAWFSPVFATSGPGCKESSPSLFANQDLRFSSQSGGICPGCCLQGICTVGGLDAGGPKPPGQVECVLRLRSRDWTLLAKRVKPPGPEQQRCGGGRGRKVCSQNGPWSLTRKAESLREQVGIPAQYETRGAEWSAWLPLEVAAFLWGHLCTPGPHGSPGALPSISAT